MDSVPGISIAAPFPVSQDREKYYATHERCSKRLYTSTLFPGASCGRSLLPQAREWLDGKSFSPDGKRFGATLMLGQFLRDLGLINIQRQAYALEYSYGTEAHETWYQDAMAWCQLLLPFLLRMGVTTQEEFDHIYQQIGVEMQEPEFRGLFFLLSVWGAKPEG